MGKKGFFILLSPPLSLVRIYIANTKCECGGEKKGRQHNGDDDAGIELARNGRRRRKGRKWKWEKEKKKEKNRAGIPFHIRR